MKKVTYFMFMVLGMVFMVGNVDAVTYAMDPDWSAASSTRAETCGDFTSELKNAKNDFSFDSKTGKFSISGQSYQDFTSGGGSAPVFFVPSEDGRKLYGYILSYNEWPLALKEEWGQAPAYDCDDTFKIVKTSFATSEEEPGDDSGDVISDPDDDTIGGSDNKKNSKTKSKTYTTTGEETEQTTNNPSTGISPFLSLPVILGGGVALVLRKKRIFG